MTQYCLLTQLLINNKRRVLVFYQEISQKLNLIHLMTNVVIYLIKLLESINK